MEHVMTREDVERLNHDVWSELRRSAVDLVADIDRLQEVARAFGTFAQSAYDGGEAMDLPEVAAADAAMLNRMVMHFEPMRQSVPAGLRRIEFALEVLETWALVDYDPEKVSGLMGLAKDVLGSEVTA